MDAMQTLEGPPPRSVSTEVLGHAIRVDCDRARRIDQLDRERPDVLLAHAREFIRHAAALSRTIERGHVGSTGHTCHK